MVWVGGIGVKTRMPFAGREKKWLGGGEEVSRQEFAECLLLEGR